MTYLLNIKQSGKEADRNSTAHQHHPSAQYTSRMPHPIPISPPIQLALGKRVGGKRGALSILYTSTLSVGSVVEGIKSNQNQNRVSPGWCSHIKCLSHSILQCTTYTLYFTRYLAHPSFASAASACSTQVKALFPENASPSSPQ